jgi:hypothetical protein
MCFPTKGPFGGPNDPQLARMPGIKPGALTRPLSGNRKKLRLVDDPVAVGGFPFATGGVGQAAVASLTGGPGDRATRFDTTKRTPPAKTPPSTGFGVKPRPVSTVPPQAVTQIPDKPQSAGEEFEVTPKPTGLKPAASRPAGQKPPGPRPGPNGAGTNVGGVKTRGFKPAGRSPSQPQALRQTPAPTGPKPNAAANAAPPTPTANPAKPARTPSPAATPVQSAPASGRPAPRSQAQSEPVTMAPILGSRFGAELPLIRDGDRKKIDVHAAKTGNSVTFKNNVTGAQHAVTSDTIDWLTELSKRDRRVAALAWSIIANGQLVNQTTDSALKRTTGKRLRAEVRRVYDPNDPANKDRIAFLDKAINRAIDNEFGTERLVRDQINGIKLTAAKPKPANSAQGKDVSFFDRAGVFLKRQVKALDDSISLANARFSFKTMQLRLDAFGKLTGSKLPARFMRRYVKGVGGTVRLNPAEFLAIPTFRRGLKENQTRLVNSTLFSPRSKNNNSSKLAILKRLPEGQTLNLGQDFWDFEPDPRAELRRGNLTTFAAFGHFDFRSTGHFSAKRTGRFVTVEGDVSHVFSDIYDFKKGAGVLGTEGDILAKRDGAKPFRIESKKWKQRVIVNFEFRDGKIINKNVKWIELR